MSTEFFVPDDTKVLSITPGEITKLRGPLVLFTYANALRQIGQDIEIVRDEIDDVKGLFWPASDSRLVSVIYALKS